MPIRPENRQRYPADWRAISARIRERADNRCEQCQAPNAEVIARGVDHHAGTYMLPDGEVRDAVTGAVLGRARGSEYPARYVRVVLTVAHLDHVPEHCDDDNLRALCQRCHLAYDQAHHAQTRRMTRRAPRALGDLFGAVS